MRKFIKYSAVALLVIGSTVPAAHAQRAMNQSDVRALNLSGNWQSGEQNVSIGDDGKVVFTYGQAQPTIICAPLMICDLELEKGEKALNVIVGDTVQWKFEGARSGPNGDTPHVLIKVKRPNISTTLVITTDRRTYHVLLKSESTKYMARVAFDYGLNSADLLTSMQAIPQPEPVYQAPEKVVELVPTLPGFLSADSLDFNYKLKANSKKVKFMPLRVFNDGTKTYIEFDKDVANAELPVFQVLGSDQKEALVNYRFVDNRFIVDQIFEEGMLILGVGSKRKTVSIKRDN